MQLPEPIAGKLSELFSGAQATNIIKVGITAISLVLALLAAVGSSSGAPQDDDSSPVETAPNTHPDYRTPSLEVQTQLATIQTEVYQAVNEMRQEQNLGLVFEYPERQDAAQLKAQTNAVTGTEEPVAENISMLQAHLPLEEASGYEFIERLRTSEPHAAVLMDSQYLNMAVSAAYSGDDNQVWLVVQFE